MFFDLVKPRLISLRTGNCLTLTLSFNRQKGKGGTTHNFTNERIHEQGPYWEDISLWSWQYTLNTARLKQKRLMSDILPVRSQARLTNKTFIAWLYQLRSAMRTSPGPILSYDLTSNKALWLAHFCSCPPAVLGHVTRQFIKYCTQFVHCDWPVLQAIWLEKFSIPQSMRYNKTLLTLFSRSVFKIWILLLFLSICGLIALHFDHKSTGNNLVHILQYRPKA